MNHGKSEAPKVLETKTSEKDVNAVEAYVPAANDDGIRVAVIGSGPAGVRFAQELLKRAPNAKLTLFGDERYQPYNRVQLSSLLAGDIGMDDITSALPNTTMYPYFQNVCAKIVSVDTDNQTIIDEYKNEHPYDVLVFATGSRPHVPHIPNVDKNGVYTFRSLKDAEALYGRVARARHVVVVGGGLLGLEAAKALQRANTNVTVIQQGPRLMNRQLDDTAAEHLLKKIHKLGIKVIANSGVRQIVADVRVSAVVTRDGDRVECDTVLLCAGIKPNIDLARASGIKVTTGILVNDQLQTSAPNVYAIGECCEHRGKSYGLVNPGFEQAAIAAAVISKKEANYIGSLEVSRLKVLGEHVASMGEVADLTPRPFLKEHKYINKADGIYRKLVTYRGQLIGAVGFGDWPELRRIQEAYQNQRRLYIWHHIRFFFTGCVWGDSQNDDVSLWPASTIVCQCNNISQGDLVSAIDQGASTIDVLSKKTEAGTVCGSCIPLLENLLGDNSTRKKETGWLAILMLSVLAFLVSVLIATLPGIALSDTAEKLAPLEMFWNDKFWKQVTGFTILGLSVVGLLMSLRKRIKNDLLGKYTHWRLLHISVGAACVLTLILHSGLHLGENLNRWLIIDFLSILALGGIAGLTLSLGHKLSANTSIKLKKFWTWGHIIVVWPFPILIALHIFSVYYY